MKTNKNTVLFYYQHMNSQDVSLLKHTGTKLFQSFTYLDHNFEIRIAKDNRCFFVIADGLCITSNSSVNHMITEHKKSETWYEQLNWEDLEPMIEYSKKLREDYELFQHTINK